MTARDYATPDGEHRVALIGLLPPVRSPARRDALLLGPRATSDELPDALKSGETAVAGEVSVSITTDETLVLDDLQQPRRPINGRSLAATQ
jgi:hypothetical protein